MVMSCTDLKPDVLRGEEVVVTSFLDEPFLTLKANHEAEAGHDKYSGFVVDMLDAIGEELGISFKINLVQDGRYGTCLDTDCRQWNGMLGEVMRGQADLAVADISITPTRVLAVDFTQPFMNGGLVALVKREAPDTYEQLFEDEDYKFYVIQGGSTEAFLRRSNDTMHQRIATRMVLTKTIADNIGLLKKGGNKMVMFIEENMATYLTGNDCSLKILYPRINQVSYGIAMAKGVAVKTPAGVYDLRSVMDHAITKLKYDGVMSRLESRWWPSTKC